MARVRDLDGNYVNVPRNEDLEEAEHPDLAAHVALGLGEEEHTHAGADIDSGTVDDARLPSGLLRDAEHASLDHTGIPGVEGGGNSTFSSAYASPPGSPAAGDLWFPSDGHSMLRHNGSLWLPVVEGIIGGLPPTSGWSWVNQDSSTVDESKDAFSMTLVVNETSNHLRVRAAPTPPYSITAALRLLANPGQAGSIGYPAARLYHRESSSGKLYDIGMFLDQGSGMAPAIEVSYWTDPDTFNSRPSGGLQLAFPSTRLTWFRIEDDNTNRKYYWSQDGRNFYLIASVPRTTNMTPDEVGWGGNPHNSNDTAGGTIVTLMSWVVA